MFRISALRITAILLFMTFSQSMLFGVQPYHAPAEPSGSLEGPAVA